MGCAVRLALCLHISCFISQSGSQRGGDTRSQQRRRHQHSRCSAGGRAMTRIRGFEDVSCRPILGPGTDRNCQSAKTLLQQPLKAEWSGLSIVMPRHLTASILPSPSWPSGQRFCWHLQWLRKRSATSSKVPSPSSLPTLSRHAEPTIEILLMRSPLQLLLRSNGPAEDEDVVSLRASCNCN